MTHYSYQMPRATRVILLLLCSLFLYACSSAATRPNMRYETNTVPKNIPELKSTTESTVSRVPAAQDTPALPALTGEAPLPPQSAPEPPSPHIALLLPLDSPTFMRAADAVRQGFYAAASAQAGTKLPIKLYSLKDQPVETLPIYQSALIAGAKVVVGPLTKNAVNMLASSTLVSIPTLALNTADLDTRPPANLYFFGLSAENEARQVARQASQEGKRSALIVSAKTSLAKRMANAFAAEWSRSSGTLVAQLEFSSEVETYAALKESVSRTPVDMIFLAADAAQSRVIVPFIKGNGVIYATSQLYDGNKDASRNLDLDGIRFVEIPWILQPDHPAVMIYPLPDNPLNSELNRLYALGIDAYRIASLLLERVPASILLDGVTGKISLQGHQFVRELINAEFRQGSAVAKDGYAH